MRHMEKRIALVTGGTRGLGLEWCKQLQDHGYTVFMGGKSPDQLERAVKALQESGYRDFSPVILDVLKPADIERIYNTVQDTTGQLDLLINNAGVNANTPAFSDDRTYELGKLEMEPLTSMFQINAFAPLLLVQKVLPLMQRSGCATIVNVSSCNGSISDKNEPVNFGYAGSKAALNMFTKILSYTLKGTGCKVISINPGWAQTRIGGERALNTAEQVVREMIITIEGSTIGDSGKFLDKNGRELNW
jgi:NAD(P)-dependent dehydrogenase (short-subunit alcohol dehydrogenase family)